MDPTSDLEADLKGDLVKPDRFAPGGRSPVRPKVAAGATGTGSTAVCLGEDAEAAGACWGRFDEYFAAAQPRGCEDVQSSRARFDVRKRDRGRGRNAGTVVTRAKRRVTVFSNAALITPAWI